MDKHNRSMRSGMSHDVRAPNFKKLKRWFGNRHKTAIEIRKRIAFENLSTRETVESWADIERENERKKRLLKIKEAWERKLAG